MKLHEVVFFVFGDQVWGKGLTQKEAWVKAYRPKRYQVFLAHESITVDEMGYVRYGPKYGVPREVNRKGLKKDEWLIRFSEPEGGEE